MRLHVADHPLVTHKLTVLRDERTPSPVFRQLTEELVTLLAYEATRAVRTETVDIRTPVTATTGLRISEPRPLVVPIEKQVAGRDVTLVLGALDERLNERGYIVPGLGDAGDRLYGTV